MRAFTVGTQNFNIRSAWVQEQLARVPAGSTLLDVGAGEQPYRNLCDQLHYIATDFARYDGSGNDEGLQTGSWRQHDLDLISDMVALPLADTAVDAVLFTDVLEHVPDPIRCLAELSRVLRPGGTLIMTAPFASLTHFAPYHFVTGFSRYFHERHLPSIGLRVQHLEAHGSYFESLAQELRRVPEMGERYSGRSVGRIGKLALMGGLALLQRLAKTDEHSSEMLNYGYFVTTVKG